MSGLRIVIPVVITMATALAATAAAPTKKPTQTAGYHVLQNLAYQGPLDMRVGAKGIHCETKELSVYLRPAVKGVLVVNRSSKKYCLLDEKVWLATKGGGGLMKDISKSGKPYTYKGMRIEEYLGRVYSSTGRFRFVSQFWTTKETKLPQAVVDYYCRIYSIPSGYGFPIKIVRWHTPDKPELFLSTQDIKPAIIAANETEPKVSGFQRTASEMELIMSDSDDELSKILDDEPGPAQTRRPLKSK